MKEPDEIFERGTGDWDKLYTFMDENDFRSVDFLACICASLLQYIDNEYSPFKTKLMVGGTIFNITIKPEKYW